MSQLGPVTQVRQPTAGQRWQQVPWRWRAVMILAAGLVVVYFASSLVGGLYNPPSNNSVGPSSSTDASIAGTAAMAQLLSDRGHPVQELTVPLHSATIPSKGTLFVLDPVGSIANDGAALRGYLDGGSSVVLGGSTGPSVLHAILGPGPSPLWEGQPSGNAQPAGHRSALAGVTTVLGGPSGSWKVGNARGFSVLLSGAGGVLAIETSVGRGSLVLLASTSPLQNGQLARADDAAFALDLAGTAGAPVAFDEYDHGLGRSGTGIAGLPSHWKAGLVVAFLAMLVWMWSAARRFGPPQRADRELIPARVAHVDAMAELLASGGVDRLADGAASLQTEGRETLRRVLRAGPGVSDEQLIDLAATAGIPSATPEVAAALLRAAGSEADVVARGRAFASLSQGGRR